MRICVVGAGIAGSFAARLLAADGHRVVLAERQPSPPSTGAGIVLTDRAMAELDRAGVRPLARRLPGGVRIVVGSGVRLLGSGPRWSLHRGALVAALADGLERVVDVRWATAASGVRAMQGGATVRLGDAEERFDLVVGADGLRSAVRRAIRPEVRPRSSGQRCWRAVVESRHEAATEWWGRGIRVGTVPLPDGMTYVYVVAPADAPLPDPTGLPAPQASAVAAVGARARGGVLVHELFDLQRPVWGSGQVVLVGDAAHAVLPNVGAGAALGIADAAALTAILRSGGAGASRRLGRSRGPSTALVQQASRMLGALAHPDTVRASVAR